MAGVADLPAEPGPAAAPVEAWAAPGASPPASAVAVATAPGVVHGVVTRGGQVVEGARVTLTAHDGVERLATTDAAGAYRFSDVPPGPYEVVVQAESGVTCEAGGCISAAWAERARDTVAAGATRRLDIDGD